MPGLAIGVTADNKPSYYRHLCARGVYVDCENVKQKTLHKNAGLNVGYVARLFVFEFHTTRVI